MGTLFFGPGPIKSYEDAKRADTGLFARFYRSMREQGIMIPPSQFEAWFVSLAHTEKEIEETLDAAQKALRAIG
jgi:glutamate-1-semialdehyde 2,1-aminomutase